ncbi:hypothetical protein B0H17DRAFT_1075513 [Mycena rosella]|uniref:Uncharacterized protein n=1 Tax=Mycena rosella TaxID=1033263 RepID=A0AAD7D6P9_MYCRO|nr:hypothetical protein B0H17DRAFT_1075513 [Mycena rosella]
MYHHPSVFLLTTIIGMHDLHVLLLLPFPPIPLLSLSTSLYLLLFGFRPSPSHSHSAWFWFWLHICVEGLTDGLVVLHGDATLPSNSYFLPSDSPFYLYYVQLKLRLNIITPTSFM